MRLTNYNHGLRAERWCRLALRLKGYHILASRCRTPVGEIDLVAVRGKVLAMIEVKARRTFDDALAAISFRQRERLQRAALAFLGTHPRYACYTVRFDAMLVAPRHWPRHIVNAWQAE